MPAAMIVGRPTSARATVESERHNRIWVRHCQIWAHHHHQIWALALGGRMEALRHLASSVPHATSSDRDAATAGSMLHRQIYAPRASSLLHACLLPRSTSHHRWLLVATRTHARGHAPPPETTPHWRRSSSEKKTAGPCRNSGSPPSCT
ncbi:hypothetical protein COCNU_contig69226226G000010 [Cocos nucifera]|nr:hypothetical protein [Cocos nucifera]